MNPNRYVPIDTVFTIGTSVVVVSNTKTQLQRTALVLTNTSTGGQSISLGFGKDAIAGSGIVLAPGGSWYEVEDAAFKPNNDRITAIASGAAGSLAVHERVREP